MQSVKQMAGSATQRPASLVAPRAAGAPLAPAARLLGVARPAELAAPVSLAPVRARLQRKQVLKAIQALAANGIATGQEKAETPLPIVFVSAEVSPWSKTGGLGDVVGGLPIELAKRGHKVITVAPRYDQYSDAWDTSVVVNIDGEQVRYFHSIKQGVHRVFVDHPSILAKVWGKTGSKLYGPKSGADYVDNHKRFALFNKAAIEATRVLPFGFGEDVVFVANDWHTSLVPVLLKDHYQPKGQFAKAKVALCIHNIAFQGRMWEDTLTDMQLPAASKDKFAFTDGIPKVYTEKDPLEENEVPSKKGGSYKKVNWLKAGILSCDKLLTVSPNYAAEIAADVAGGVELDKYVREKGVEGIVNGMDVEEWDPRVDKYLTVKYDKNTVYAGKAAAKEALQADTGLPIDAEAPLFAFIGRLEEQKGVDILLAAVPKILAKAPNAQIVVLGTGKAKFEKQVAALDKQFKGKYKGVVKFSAPLAHLITAGADFILVPSRFEPCGLIQLHAMQYGTVPVVSSTGGLVDTVKEGVTGFHMGALDTDKLNEADVEALASTAARAAQAFTTPLFKDMVYNCISQDLSWAKPAKKWEGVLEQLYLGLSSGKEKAASVAIPVQERIPSLVAATDKPLTRASAATSAAAPVAAPAGKTYSGATPAATPSFPAPTPAIPAPISTPSAPSTTTTYTPRTTFPAAAPSVGPKPAVTAAPTPSVAAPKPAITAAPVTAAPAKVLVSAGVGASSSSASASE